MPGRQKGSAPTWAVAGAALLLGVLLSLWLDSLRPPSRRAGAAPDRSGAGPASPPERIVVLSPALAEIVFHMGAGSLVTAVPDFLTAPPQALSLPRVGGSFNPAFERILELRPDFLLFQGKSAKVRDFARRHGIPCPEPPLELDTLEDLFQAYRRIGVLLGRPVAAEEAAHRVRSALARVLEATLRSGPGPRVFLALGHRRGTLAGLYTATDRTFLGELLRIAGGRNVFGSAPGNWPQVSLESLQARAPQVVLDFHPGESPDGRSLLEDWRRDLPGVPAVLMGRVYVLTQDFLLTPGPRAARTAELLAELLREGGSASGRPEKEDAPRERRKEEGRGADR